MAHFSPSWIRTYSLRESCRARPSRTRPALRLHKGLAMNLLLLGSGKTGSLVAAVARERGPALRLLRRAARSEAAGLSPASLTADPLLPDTKAPQPLLP